MPNRGLTRWRIIHTPNWSPYGNLPGLSCLLGPLWNLYVPPILADPKQWTSTGAGGLPMAQAGAPRGAQSSRTGTDAVAYELGPSHL